MTPLVSLANEVRVSILLVTRNGRETLPGVLDAIRRQDAPFPFEMVAVDSGSTDGTPHVLRAAGARVLGIAPSDFNHGTTRNLGVEACRGELVVLLVQDAEPDGSGWLAGLVTPLFEDGSLAGAYARQVPREGSGIVAKAYLSRYRAAADSSRLQALEGGRTLAALSPQARLDLCTFDNVCSCVRRSVWRSHPFPSTPIAEDIEWARNVLSAGYRLAYVADARVRHLHNRTARYELCRTYLTHQQLRRLFGLCTVPSVAATARGILASLVNHASWIAREPAPFAEKLAQLPRAAALAVALPVGQYLGARSADLHRDLLSVRGV